MKPSKIKELDDLWYNYGHIDYQQLLIQNTYPDLPKIIDGIYKIVSANIKVCAFNVGFDDVFIVDKEQYIELERGNSYYVNLLRNNHVLTNENSELESLTPLTDTIKEIISIFNNQHQNKGGKHFIYIVLYRLLLAEIGKQIAYDEDVVTYDQWSAFYTKDFFNNEMFRGWINNIPSHHLDRAQVEIFANLESGKLEDMAYLKRPSNENTRACESYVKLLSQISDQKAFHYITDAIHNSDYIELKDGNSIDNELVFKTGLNNWLNYIDQSQYPIIQNHLLLSIKEPEEFKDLILLVCQKDNLMTDKTRLITQLLIEYYDYLDRNLADLKLYKAENITGDSSKQQSVIYEANTLYNYWLDVLILESFRVIFELLTTIPESQGDLLHNIFLWVNSHDEIFINKDLKSRALLIQTIKDQFMKAVTNSNTEIKLLIDPLTDSELNWNILGSMVEMLETKNSTELRDNIFIKYTSFIQSNQLFYHSGINANINVLIKSAYSFSKLVMTFDSPLDKWLEMHYENKAYYNGWITNQHNDDVSSREGFLLTAGIGIASAYYACKQKEKGANSLLQISGTLVQQIMQKCETLSNEYVIPVLFLGSTINKNYSKDLLPLILDFTCHLDSLEQVLILWSEINTFPDDKEFYGAVEKAKERINEEFWAIEIRYDNTRRKHELSPYIKIKNKIEALAL